jgi:hypothetical protein
MTYLFEVNYATPDDPQADLAAAIIEAIEGVPGVTGAARVSCAPWNAPNAAYELAAEVRSPIAQHTREQSGGKE